MSAYHVGIMSDAEVLERCRRGLPAYRPTDPKPTEQAPYIEFASKRGPNSE